MRMQTQKNLLSQLRRKLQHMNRLRLPNPKTIRLNYLPQQIR
jgi:hypothetical protein